MQGVLQQRRGEYQWMRIGFATTRWANAVKLALALTLVLLAIWLYLELPASAWRWAVFLGIYLVTALVYLNAGVWLHEQLHCLGCSGSIPAGRSSITYVRTHLLILGGYYKVRGGMSYQAASRALLGPLMMTGALLLIAFVGSLLLPGWWMPWVLSLVIVSLIDMLHDFYMYSQIRPIGGKARYWDRGKVLEAVWKGSEHGSREHPTVVQRKLRR